MIDKINKLNQLQGTQNIPELKKQGKEDKRVEKSNGAQEADKLVIEEGKKVAQYIEMAKSYPEVRVELVEKIKKAIENNAFSVNPEKIAKKLLEG
ncbi:MAG: flagellar biosynthesis anti-sigma factor FlgM [Fervidobacterium sp.]